MKNIQSNIYFFKALVLSFALFITSCDEEAIVDPANAPSALSFDIESYSFEVENDESAYDITVQATTVSNVDRTVALMVNDEETDATSDQYSFSPEVIIPAGSLKGSTTVDFDYDVLDFGDARNLTLDLALTDDQTANLKRPEFTLTFVKQCTLNNVVLSITTDDYPEETSWELYDLGVSTTVPINAGGPFDPDVVADGSVVEIVFCLGAGSYGVVVIDSYGDGIAGGGYSISSDGTVLASGIVPGGNPENVPSSGSSTFDLL